MLYSCFNVESNKKFQNYKIFFRYFYFFFVDVQLWVRTQYYLYCFLIKTKFLNIFAFCLLKDKQLFSVQFSIKIFSRRTNVGRNITENFNHPGGCPVKVDNLRVVEAVAQRCSVKKVLLEIFQNSQENTCAGVSFSIKLQSEPGVFLWILRNFQERFFLTVHL